MGGTPLDRIEHIVVVMMENRSFDHMLGYLMQDGLPEVNGLTGEEFNLGPDGTKVPLTAFDADAHRVQRTGEALQKKLDPDHSKRGVHTQIGPGYGTEPMGAFVKAFVETRKPEDQVGRDHQPPPRVHDDSGYSTLGVRVPALLVGPRVRRHVCHEVFEHTSLIKTILTRFAAHPKEAIAQMPPRVAAARDFGGVLQDEPRRDIPGPDDARREIAGWRATARTRRQADPRGAVSPEPDGAGRPYVMHDFQDEFARFALAMHHVVGLPAGQP